MHFMNQDPKYVGIKVGKYTYGQPKIMIADEATLADLEIGAFCSIAEDVTILLDGEHRKERVTAYPFDVIFHNKHELPYSNGPVKIGNDVWIGTGALIMSGVTIGDGAIIGARAVVRKDVPAYSIVIGNPAQVVRYRFSSDQIKKLLKIRWWDWSDELIFSNYGYLVSGNIDCFIAIGESILYKMNQYNKQ